MCGHVHHLINSYISYLAKCVKARERTVQQKVDRSGPVLFSRVRPAIQYRSSTDGLMRDGGGEGALTVGFGLHVDASRLLWQRWASFVNGYSADCTSVSVSCIDVALFIGRLWMLISIALGSPWKRLQTTRDARLAATWVVCKWIPYTALCVGLSSESQREKIECLSDWDDIVSYLPAAAPFLDAGMSASSPLPLSPVLSGGRHARL